MIALFADPAVFAVAAGLFGLMVGSFLNVVIHRLPIMMQRNWAAQCAELNNTPPPVVEPLSLARPRSRCPKCGHPISALENLPILSWIVLRGKCKACTAPISVRYPLIEATTGLLFAFAAWHFGFTLAGLGALVLIGGLIALTGIDFDTQLLPDDITLPMLWIGLALNMFNAYTDLKSAVIGAMVGYLVWRSVYWGFKLITGKEGMGYGDFKFLAAIGAWAGWQTLPLALLVSAGAGAVVGVAMMVITKRGREVRMPFGPWLAVGGSVCLLWGRDAVIAYLGRFPP